MGKGKKHFKPSNKRPRLDGGAAAGGGDDGAFSPAGLPHGGTGSRPDGYASKLIDSNPAFEAYYRAQGIVGDEAEFQELLATMRRPLPVTFRVNALCPDAASIVSRLAGEFGGSTALDDGTVADPPRTLPWYPGGLAYHLSVGRAGLRKNARARELHAWVVALSTAGLISRQEAVSMVPPLLLDVQPHHVVLDMCASPGSKTAQMLEALHAGEEAGVAPTGMVVANDNDTARAYMLVHMCQRINSPALLVTCHDAQNFPSYYHKVAPGGKGAGGPRHRDDGHFDRVLCDVPCTGE